MDEEEADLWRRINEQNRLNAMLEGNASGGIGSGEYSIIVEDVFPEQDVTFKMVKQRLVTHFNVAHSKWEVYWPTRDGTLLRSFISYYWCKFEASIYGKQSNITEVMKNSIY